eukprot:7135346-Alexandrium_andersonii.AAC.1
MCIRDSLLPPCQETAGRHRCRHRAPAEVADPTCPPAPEYARRSPRGPPLWGHLRAASSSDCRGVAPRHKGQRAVPST